MDFQSMNIKEVKEWFKTAERATVEPVLLDLKKDTRSGVQQLLRQWEQKEKQHQQLLNKWNFMNQEEEALRQQGIIYIAGIDEVGRGPLAGPVVACTVILPNDFYLLGIDDSKKVSAHDRELFAVTIKEKAISYSITYVDSKEIDRLNIYQATIKAMEEAITELTVQPEYLLIDAMRLANQTPQKSIIKGDAKSVSIAAASIVAKASRDEYMKQMAVLYPQYGFERNMGYGTREHLEAIQQFGITPIHRRSFLNNQIALEFA